MTKLELYRVSSTDEEVGHGHYNFVNLGYTQADLEKLYLEQDSEKTHTSKFIVEKLEFSSIKELLGYINRAFIKERSDFLYLKSKC